MLLLAIVGELISLLIVIVVSHIDIDVILWILSMLIILCVLCPVIHRTFCTRISSSCVISQAQTLRLDWVRQNIFCVVQILF